MDLLNDTFESILINLLAISKQHGYKGYNKHDGLLSPFLSTFLGHSRIGRLLAIQFIMRFPFNIRPFLFVPQTRNPKGTGLFAHAYLNSHQLTNRVEFLDEAERLLKWLEENANHEYEGTSWGYQYPWQDVGFFAPPHFPNRVVTCWIGFSFIKAWHITKNSRYLNACKKICTFLRDAPNKIIDTDEELCLSYVPDKFVTWAVMDVSALVGKMFALTGIAADDGALLADAKRCMQYIINRQTDYGAWFYTDPPKDSHITHDNYHTGIILDCINDYMNAIQSDIFADSYKKGLEYYAKHLFLSNGAPKWMNNKVYPFDIHGAAQGIITFSKASQKIPQYLEIAKKILVWTKTNLYSEKAKQFWYQKEHFFTKRFTLMRWCNAWMAFALTMYLSSCRNAYDI
jgi:hypothetical protein